jgi:predicted DCC family thiol-disulfide oxidoreductase YuxK
MTSATPIWPDDGTILYDGVCVLCSSWIRFVARRDVARRFRFTPISSPYGRRLAETLGINSDDPDTNAVILDGQVFRRSDAALAVVATLPGWAWVSALRVVPRAIRDSIYTLIAQHRYRIFGRHDVCDLGGSVLAGRVIVNRPRRFGALRGKACVDAAFFEPLPESELKEWE